MGYPSKRGIIEGRTKPLEIERKFMDLLKLIIEGGWVVQDEEEWFKVLDFIGVFEVIVEN